jgi:hypothetical protein
MLLLDLCEAYDMKPISIYSVEVLLIPLSGSVTKISQDNESLNCVRERSSGPGFFGTVRSRGGGRSNSSVLQ